MTRTVSFVIRYTPSVNLVSLQPPPEGGASLHACLYLRGGGGAVAASALRPAHAQRPQTVLHPHHDPPQPATPRTARSPQVGAPISRSRLVMAPSGDSTPCHPLVGDRKRARGPERGGFSPSTLLTSLTGPFPAALPQGPLSKRRRRRRRRSSPRRSSPSPWRRRRRRPLAHHPPPRAPTSRERRRRTRRRRKRKRTSTRRERRRSRIRRRRRRRRKRRRRKRRRTRPT